MECSGINKENSGGLSSAQYDLPVMFAGSTGCSLCLDAHGVLDPVTTNVLSKCLVANAIDAWMHSDPLPATPSIVMKSIAEAGRLLQSVNLINWEKVELVLTSQPGLNRLEMSARRYGLGSFATILQIASLVTSNLPRWVTESILDVEACIPTKCVKGNCESKFLQSWASRDRTRSLATLADLCKLMHISDYQLGSAKDKGLLHSFQVISSTKQHIPQTFTVSGTADYLVTVGRIDGAGTSTSIVLNLCTANKAIGTAAKARASLCATLADAACGAVLNVLTGEFVLLSPQPQHEIEQVAKCFSLSTCACHFGNKCIPVDNLPFLCNTSSVAVLHTTTTGRELRSERTCAVLLTNFAVVAAASWTPQLECSMAEEGAQEFEDTIIARRVNEWLSSKSDMKSVLLVHVGMRTEQVLGDLVSKAPRSTSLKHLFSSMARVTTGKHGPVTSKLLLNNSKSALSWCLSILKETCTSFDSKLSNVYYQDTSIAVICVLKALLNWDTVV